MLSIAQRLPEMAEMPNWVVWFQSQDASGKTTKKPFSPSKYELARSNDATTWASFQRANRALEISRGFYKGVSFSLGESNKKKSGVVAIDLDHCVTEGKIEQYAQEIIDSVGGYTEYSPSRAGIHIFCPGSLPGPSRRKGPIEFYDNTRFMTVTGNRLTGTYNDGSIESLSALYSSIFKEKTTALPQASSPSLLVDDEGVVERIFRSKSSEKFHLLSEGKTLKYPSWSEAVFGFCSIISFWAQSAVQVYRIASQFTITLHNPKWLSRRGDTTYGFLTSNRAFSTINCRYGMTK